MKTKTLFISVVSGVVVICLIVALVLVFNVRQPYVPSESTIEIVDTTEWGNLEANVTTSGGTVQQSDVETAEGKYYRTLTAVPSEGYTFAYWKNSSIKLSGDLQLTLGASSLTALNTVVSACTPVFVEDANVFEITDISTFQSILINDISQDSTSGKIYKLTTDLFGVSDKTSGISESLGVFRGVLDGNNHSLSGIDINGVGLFTSLDDAVIKDLVLSNGNINGDGSEYIGSFCGSINNSLISRCLSYLNITNSNDNGFAGGIVGVCSSTTQKSLLFSCGFYGVVRATNPQQMIAFNTKLASLGTDSCSVFRPKNNGAINTL